MSEFGYHTIGANSGGGGFIRLCKFSAPTQGGTITQVSQYTNDNGQGAHSFRMALYSDVAGVPTTLLAQCTADVALGTTLTWYDCAFSYNFNANDVLWMASWQDDTSIIYDNLIYYETTGSTDQHAYLVDPGGYPTWPTTFPTPNGYAPAILSMYATYTAGPGAILGGSASTPATGTTAPNFQVPIS